ncbi:hypothetical protein BC826DRAFT_395692 [Russula brevipes]|nr:hypothetical protein BC826DRAFT_395692 [Russula brevipes]
MGLLVFTGLLSATVAAFLIESSKKLSPQLGCLSRDCPHRTPMSSVCWYLWQAFAFLAAFCHRWILRRLHSLLVPYNLGEVKSRRQRKLTEWLEDAEISLDKHAKGLRDGFRESIIQAALDAPSVVDLKALTWLLDLPALVEKNKIRHFVANAPAGAIVYIYLLHLEQGLWFLHDRVATLRCSKRTRVMDGWLFMRCFKLCSIWGAMVATPPYYTSVSPVAVHDTKAPIPSTKS